MTGSASDFDAEAHAAAMERAMRLPIRPDWRPMVVAHLATTAAIAEKLLAFPLDDHVEPAPVFEAK